MTTIIQDRLARVQTLYRGNHTPDGQQMCIMEAVAYVVGEPWTDQPACVDPILATLCRGINDYMPDDMRQLLIPYIPLLIGTKGTTARSIRRAFVAADYAVRVFAPIALRASCRESEAAALEQLEPITNPTNATAAAAAASASYAANAASYAANAASYAANAASTAAAATAASATAANAASTAAAATAASATAASASAAAATAASAAVWTIALQLISDASECE